MPTRSTSPVNMTTSTRKKWLLAFNESKDYPLKLQKTSHIFCKVCEKSFSGIQKSQVKQHLESDKHRKNSQLKRPHRQAQLEDLHHESPKKSKSEILGQELCSVFLAANIPWIKLSNPQLRQFLERHMAVSLPDESTLRKKFMTGCYEEAMESIKNALKGKPVWVSVDSTTDAQGREVANVIVGELIDSNYVKPFLVNCAFMDKVNSSSTARLVNDSLHTLDSLFEVNQAKVLLSDAAPYMIKCGKDLRVFYPSLIHVTCCAHGLHRLCEKIRELHPKVNKLISSVKEVFLKAPSRRNSF